jgi:hypothetical protein
VVLGVFSLDFFLKIYYAIICECTGISAFFRLSIITLKYRESTAAILI